jgi:hypothetical protein
VMLSGPGVLLLTLAEQTSLSSLLARGGHFQFPWL